LIELRRETEQEDACIEGSSLEGIEMRRATWLRSIAVVRRRIQTPYKIEGCVGPSKWFKISTRKEAIKSSARSATISTATARKDGISTRESSKNGSLTSTMSKR